MELKDAVVTWDNEGNILVGPLESLKEWDVGYPHMWGGCDDLVLMYSEDECTKYTLAKALDIITGLGIDPVSVHFEFLKIDEYREMMG